MFKPLLFATSRFGVHQGRVAPLVRFRVQSQTRLPRHARAWIWCKSPFCTLQLPRQFGAVLFDSAGLPRMLNYFLASIRACSADQSIHVRHVARASPFCGFKGKPKGNSLLRASFTKAPPNGSLPVTCATLTLAFSEVECHSPEFGIRVLAFHRRQPPQLRTHMPHVSFVCSVQASDMHVVKWHAQLRRSAMP